MLKAVCFDFDGTLFDSDKVHLLCWNKAVEEYGIGVTLDEYSSRHAGHDTSHIAASIIDHNRIEADPAKIARDKKAAFQEWLTDDVLPPMHYAVEAVSTFVELGLTVAVVTGARRNEVIQSLDHYGITEKLSAIVSRDDVEISKPNPESYHLVLERIGVDATDCVTFEDTQSGIASAKSAGVACVAVENEYSRGHTLTDADHRAVNLEEATAWVIERYGLDHPAPSDGPVKP